MKTHQILASLLFIGLFSFNSFSIELTDIECRTMVVENDMETQSIGPFAVGQYPGSDELAFVYPANTFPQYPELEGKSLFVQVGKDQFNDNKIVVAFQVSEVGPRGEDLIQLISSSSASLSIGNSLISYASVFGLFNLSIQCDLI